MELRPRSPPSQRSTYGGRASVGKDLFGPGLPSGLVDKDTIVRNWWAVAPSSTEQQIEPEQIQSAQEAVASGKATPHEAPSAGILSLALSAIAYPLYFGKEICSQSHLRSCSSCSCNRRCTCYTSGF